MVLICCWIGILLAGAEPLRVLVIGDSLSAEYESITGFPGVDDPTEYGAISVPGWESMSWVEVMGRLRGSQISFGAFNPELTGWGPLRFSGYELNFSVPGFTAGQFEQVVNSSIFNDPQLLPYRQQLAGALQDRADAVVIWLGANELRANYGFLYDGNDPGPLINGLVADLAAVIDFVRAQKPAIKLVVVNLPDLGATPTKQADHPDPTKRAKATAATVAANEAIAVLAASRGVPVANIFPDTYRLVLGETVWIGPVNLFPGREADNHPRYQFTRDGLHPNTCLQSIIARKIVDALNAGYAAAIPVITDGEILELIGIDPMQTYFDWVAANSLTYDAAGDDGDGDGLINLAEFIFDLEPHSRSTGPVSIVGAGPAPVVRFQPHPDRLRLVNVMAEWGTTLGSWAPVPSGNVAVALSGEVTITLPGGEAARFVRVRLAVRPVN